jgi:hypothetical protein
VRRTSTAAAAARRGTIRVVARTDEPSRPPGDDRRFRSKVGEADAELDQTLSDELDKVNAAATRGTAPARELTVRIHDESGRLAAGMSGWTWGVAAGIGMT